MRNNLLIGEPGDTYNGFSNGSGKVMRIADLDESTADMDYDGYGTLASTFTGRFGSTNFSSLAQLRSRTTEKNAIRVALNSFAAQVSYPDGGANEYGPADLRLAASSPAVNAGVALPTINGSAVGAPEPRCAGTRGFTTAIWATELAEVSLYADDLSMIADATER